MIRFHYWVTFVAMLFCSVPCCRAQLKDKPTPQTLDANGVKISYWVQGKGEPVVLIHGWLSSSKINWASPGISDLLAKNYQVIALDVRGHGLSDKPTKEDAYGPELVEDIVRLLDHLKIKKRISSAIRWEESLPETSWRTIQIAFCRGHWEAWAG